MAEDLTLLQAGVGRLQGANAFYIKADGNFQFFDSDVTGLQLKTALYGQMQRQIIGQGAASTAFSVETYPGNIGLVVFSMTSTCIAGSFNFSTVVKGEEVILKLHQGSTESGEVTVKFSGCSYVGIRGSTLDSITLHNSVASTAWLHMKCFSNGEWTVVGYKDQVVCEE